MRANILLLISLFPFSHSAPSLGVRDGFGGPSSDGIEDGSLLRELAFQAYENAMSVLPESGPCNTGNVQVRKEFRYLPLEERKAYIDAVLCLQSLPSIFNHTIFNGAKTRYDDFVAIHIKLAFVIHFTANFLTWHRYYEWTFHQALVKECGYWGTQPYWEWGLDVASPRDSPIFNGDEYSLGSDGASVPHGPLVVAVPGVGLTIVANVSLPPGTGGGCIFSGPFVNYTVNLGPLAVPGILPVPTDYTYNPRCLKRDLSPFTAQNWTSFANYTPIILEAQTPYDFQTLLDGDSRNPANQITLGAHGGGHFTIAGDPGSDFRVSPGDPAFFLHHGQIDRVYWIWQNLHLDRMAYRQSSIPNLTVTIMDFPPSPLGTLDDYLDLGALNPPLVVRDSLDTKTGSPFCYVYQ